MGVLREEGILVSLATQPSPDNRRDDLSGIEAMSTNFNFGANDHQYAIDFTGKRPPEVQAKTADGMKQADENADGRWKHVFDACVLAAARKKPEITSDDVLAEIEALPNPPDTHNLAAIGPAMKRAEQMGILAYTDRVKRSERPEKHGNRQNVWLSKYYRETEVRQ